MSILKRLPEITEAAKKEYGELSAKTGGAEAASDLKSGRRPSEGNLLVHSDNLVLMDGLLACGSAESIDFIYVDPPFFTNSDRKTKGGEAAYGDTWNSLEDFLSMLAKRLLRMRELLSESGSIAVHLDWHAVHYVKVIMDEIFGEENFVNELIWTYKSGGAGKRSFAKKHDTILLYSKSKKYYFEPQKEVSYNRGLKPYRFKGVKEYQDEHGWYTLVNHKDVLNFDMVGRTSKERCGYPTQKPVKLLELLIKSCCPEGGVCADFFCGSGSLAIAALNTGRRFIICDLGEPAVELCRERLDKAGAEYVFQNRG